MAEQKEIGGYIELEYAHGEEYYSNIIRLNCGRNCLAYLIEVYNIKKIFLPYFLCSSVENICKKYSIEIEYYHIDKNFFPIVPKSYSQNDWFYLVNYYGQISNKTISSLNVNIKQIIVDNAQAFFQEPIEQIPTIYTCRKFFGVADGAYLCNSKKIERTILQDYSYDRMRFLLGRFEKTANEFYWDYNNNNKMFSLEEIKIMSKLTQNLLQSIDYNFVKHRREENFSYLDEKLSAINELSLKRVEGAFAYPLYIKNGFDIRKKLQENKIYVPTLWPDVFNICDSSMLEYDLARNILPIPVDQRYGKEEMDLIINLIKNIT